MTALPDINDLLNATSEAEARTFFTNLRAWAAGVAGTAGDKIYQDEIAEATADSGVSVDGVLLKDGELHLDLGGGKTVKTSNMTAADFGLMLQLNTAGTGLEGVGPFFGHRNRLENGGFQVWQEGTSFTDLNGYFADRWFANRNAGAAGLSASRQGDASQWLARLQRASGNSGTDQIDIRQGIETDVASPLIDRQATFSIEIAKGANWAGGDITLYIDTSTATDQQINSGTWTTAGSLAVTPTATRTNYSVTATIPDAARSVRVRLLSSAFTGTAGTDDYFEIGKAQLEAGPRRSVFEYRPLGIELLLCQRFLWKSLGTIRGFQGYTVSGNTEFGTLWFPVRMRTTPTITLTDVANGNFPAGVASVHNAQADSFGVFKASNGTGNGYFDLTAKADANL